MHVLENSQRLRGDYPRPATPKEVLETGEVIPCGGLRPPAPPDCGGGYPPSLPSASLRGGHFPQEKWIIKSHNTHLKTLTQRMSSTCGVVRPDSLWGLVWSGGSPLPAHSIPSSDSPYHHPPTLFSRVKSAPNITLTGHPHCLRVPRRISQVIHRDYSVLVQTQITI